MSFFKDNPLAGMLMGPVLGTAIQGKKSPWMNAPMALPLLQNAMGLGSLAQKQRRPAPPMQTQKPWEDPTYWQNYWKSNPYQSAPMQQQPPQGGGY